MKKKVVLTVLLGLGILMSVFIIPILLEYLQICTNRPIIYGFWKESIIKIYISFLFISLIVIFNVVTIIMLWKNELFYSKEKISQNHQEAKKEKVKRKLEKIEKQKQVIEEKEKNLKQNIE